MNYISNSSPLIAFIKKRELNLLKELFDQIFIPEAVYDELFASNEYIEQKRNLKKAIKDGWIIVKRLKNFKIGDLNLGDGENEAINLCLEINNSVLLIDEKKGRLIAKTFNIKTLGTLGILFLSQKKGLKKKDALLKNLDKLIKQNFYLSSEVILSFLKKLGSSS
ncbi:MAG: hypothetical protein GF329_22790 [Candidatus Lokiarchaeota archaeon]|nr:hypothetical protein [Candidatus Lokiarchaeota archaeon]